jgi:uncharacterized Zn-binding protein involved in type VI secretion
MSQIVVNGASIVCPLGKPGTATLVVLPTSRVQAGKQPVATIQDSKPMANIPTFGMCTSPTNPLVIAKLGAPQNCLPIVPAPWAPGSPTVQVGGVPALTSDSKCMCTNGGVITVSKPGQQKTKTG